MNQKQQKAYRKISADIRKVRTKLPLLNKIERMMVGQGIVKVSTLKDNNWLGGDLYYKIFEFKFLNEIINDKSILPYIKIMVENDCFEELHDVIEYDTNNFTLSNVEARIIDELKYIYHLKMLITHPNDNSPLGTWYNYYKRFEKEPSSLKCKKIQPKTKRIVRKK